MLKPVLCAASVLLSYGVAHAQVPLDRYADKDGYINVQTLTCQNLANTYQEDADFLGLWYSGWYNGLAKKSSINIPRVKENIHQVIVYCKANQSKRIIDAIDAVLKAEKQKSTR